jgi:8-oxo-dGTP pyrophosphatase MutT (NUDIX family)
LPDGSDAVVGGPEVPQPEIAAETRGEVMPVPAVSVLVLREMAGRLQCWMMQRVSQMLFAPNAVVFPGGRVDPSDADAAGGWHGPPAESFAARMGVGPDIARQLIIAAARELFEESGILLAYPVPDLDRETARRALEGRRLSFGDLMSACECSVDVTQVVPWRRIVTPPSERRRYDTWFFALLTDGNVTAAEVNSEATAAGWIDVEEMLRLWAGRRRTVLPPTVYLLRTLSQTQTLTGIASSGAHRAMTPIHPQVHVRAGGEVIVEVDGMDIPVHQPRPMPS